MAPLAPGAKFFVSPHGVHVATFENSGSRAVIYYDGVPGPKFDEIIGGDSNLPTMISVAFSPDGKRYAYCGHLGNEFVVMVDGKEMTRSSESWLGKFSGRSCSLGFTSNSKHVFYTSDVATSMMTGASFTRFVFDGKGSVSSSPGVQANGEVGGIHPVFSPDGDHYAYIAIDPADQHKWGLVIDGKMAPYHGANRNGARTVSICIRCFTRRCQGTVRSRKPCSTANRLCVPMRSSCTSHPRATWW